MKRLGIDVGGTFTDVVLVDDEAGRHWSVKVPTTPRDRVVGAIEGFSRILELSGTTSGEIDFIGHGTTMATNMVVEHKGAPTALITTKGFRDILEIRRVSRHDRADLYDLQFDAPKPLVQRRWCLELRRAHRARRRIADAAVGRRGRAARGQDRRLGHRGGGGLPAALLHQSRARAHGRGDPAAAASRIASSPLRATSTRNCMEYERTSTTVINAMLGPGVQPLHPVLHGEAARR